MRVWITTALMAASLSLAGCGSTPAPTVTSTSGREESTTAAPALTPTADRRSAATVTASNTPSSRPVVQAVTMTPTATDMAPSAGLPDLVVQAEYYNTEPVIFPCMTHNPAMAFRICVRNQGSGAAGPFVVTAQDSPNASWAVAGLEPGAQVCYEPEFAWFGVIVVDATNAVLESNEDNYTVAAIPTQHPQCTATP